MAARCCSHRRIFPTATQGFIQRDLALQLRQPGLHQGLLHIEERALGIQCIQCAGNAIFIAQIGQLGAHDLGCGLSLLSPQLFA